MSLPNILTLSRIVLAVVLFFLLVQHTLIADILAAVVFTIASLSDFFDGHLAKKRGMISDFGKIMDPIADKILILSVFLVFAYMGLIAWWMVIVIAVREIAVTVFRLVAMAQGRVLAAENAGKIKTVLQIIAVSLILLYLIASQTGAWFVGIQNAWLLAINVLMLIAVAVTVVSGGMYFRQRS